ncbi:MAG: hypothetical protein ACLRSW_17515 [Christensenellaceae bacterium]
MAGGHRRYDSQANHDSADNPKHSYEAYKTAADMGLTHRLSGRIAAILFPAMWEGSEDMEEMQTWFTELA